MSMSAGLRSALSQIGLHYNALNELDDAITQIDTDSGPVQFTPTQTIASAAGATLESFALKATTITVSGSTNITTAGGFNFAEFEQPTITSSSSLTISTASTFKIDGAPAAGGSATITTAYALWVSAGMTELDGGLTLGAGSNLKLDASTASATTGAATLNKQAGVITSESITTAVGSSYTLTLTNSVVTAASKVFASACLGTSTQGQTTVREITPGSGSVTIIVKNTDSTNAYNGTIKISFLVIP